MRGATAVPAAALRCGDRFFGGGMIVVVVPCFLWVILHRPINQFVAWRVENRERLKN